MVLFTLEMIWQCCIVMALLIPIQNQIDALSAPVVNEPSRWQRRTAKRRQRTEDLLHLIEQKTDNTPTSSMTNDIPTLKIPTQYKINWDEVIPELDPMRGGKIRQGTSKRTERGLRKRDRLNASTSSYPSFLNRKIVMLQSLTLDVALEI